METADFIINELDKVKTGGNDDCYSWSFYPVSSEMAAKAREKFEIDSSEKILYVLTYNSLGDMGVVECMIPGWNLFRVVTGTTSIFVITDAGIRKKGAGTDFEFAWSGIEQVQYGDNFIRIHYDTESERVHSDLVSEPGNVLFEGVSTKEVANFLTTVSEYVKSIKSPFEELDEMLEKEEYDNFLVESEKLLLANADEPIIRARANRVRLLIERGPKMAYQEANVMLLNFNDNLFTKDQNFEALGNFVQQYEELCDQYSEDGRAEALPYWTQCRDLVPDEVSRRDFQKKIDSLYTLSIPKFLEIPYHKRKFLAIDSKLSMFPESLHVLKRDELPEGVIFPEGHPVENELYICHPYKQNLYIPYETCEFVLFEDKVREYCEVLECLGAKEVFIEDSLNDETTTKVNRNLEVEAEGNAKINKASVDIKMNSKNDKYESLKRQLGLHQEYNPIGKPSIPNNLVWYPNETKWRRLFEQRQRGSITKHDEFLSISTELQTGTNELTSVKADFRALIVKIKGSVSHEFESMFENKTSSEWKVSVEFYPLSELPDSAPQIAAQTTPAQIESNNSKVENEYREEVKFCFEDDGLIDEKERAMLNRLQTRLGIGDDRAKEIEDDVISGGGLSATEKDYYELYEEFLKNDGIIDEKERRLLQREQSKLGLSDEKVKEIESKINQ